MQLHIGFSSHAIQRATREATTVILARWNNENVEVIGEADHTKVRSLSQHTHTRTVTNYLSIIERG